MKLLLVLIAVMAVNLSLASDLPCPKICTADYRPICGEPKYCAGRLLCRPLITFSNPCALLAYNCDKTERESKLHSKITINLMKTLFLIDNNFQNTFYGNKENAPTLNY